MYKPTQKQLSYFRVEKEYYLKKDHLFFNQNAAIRFRCTWRKALQLTIAKWLFLHQYLLRHPSIHYIICGGSETCVLCIRTPKGNCKNCLVYKYTGEIGCIATPYVEYRDATSRKDALKAAGEAIKFLRKMYTHFYGEV